MSETPNEGRNGITRNWALSLASWAVPLALTFFATPIIIGYLGTEIYGLYAVILGYLALAFSTGVGKLSAKYIPEYRAAGSAEELSGFMSATMMVACGLGLLQAILLVAAARLIAGSVLGLTGASEQAVVTGLQIAAVAGLLTLNSQVFQFAIQGLHRFDIYSGLTILSGALSSFGSILLVVNGVGLTGLLVWNASVTLFIGLLFFLACRPLLPEWRFVLMPERRVFRQVLVYAGSIIAYQAVTSILYAFERSMIVRRFGSEAVTFFVIPQTLALYLHAFVGTFVQVLFPVVNELLADREKLALVYLRSTRLVFIVTAFLVGSYIGTGRYFLDLWLGTKFGDRSGPLLTLLAISFGLNAVSMVVWLLAEAFKAPMINAFSSLLLTFIAMPLMLLTFSIEGFAIARLAGVAATLPLIFFIERRFLGRVFSAFWLRLFIRGLAATAVLVVVQSTVIRFVGESWIGFMAAGGCGAAAFFVMLLVTGLITMDEIKAVLGSLSRGKKIPSL